MDIVVTRHADQRIKERIPGMKSAEREERTMSVGAGILVSEADITRKGRSGRRASGRGFW